MRARTNWRNAPRSRTAKNCRRSNRPRRRSRSSSRSASSSAASICAPKKKPTSRKPRLATLIADRDDLVGAIERLRRGIQSLNREGRERLLASFEKVNANFQDSVHQAVRRRRSQAHLHRIRGSAGSRPGNLRPPARQAAAIAGAAFRRRTGADRDGADLRGVPGQSGPGLRAGRSGRAAGRRQCRALLQDADADDARCRAPASWSSPTTP